MADAMATTPIAAPAAGPTLALMLVTGKLGWSWE
jgi:hypothetical protein